jgi:glycosyltransferase involved in cell wall biosynthesis
VNILYLVKHFPCLYQSFVINEVAALTERGCAVHVVSAIDLRQPVALDPVVASRVSYLRYGYLYRYEPPVDPRGDAELARAAADVLAAREHPVPLPERRRLWAILGEREPDAAVRTRGFLDALDVVSVVVRAGITHLHCDFAEDNVGMAHIVSQATGIPFTFKMRAYDIFSEPHPEVGKWAAAAARVLTISGYNRDYICRQWSIPREKVTVIHDGVKLEQTPPIANYAHRPFRIVSVARLVEKKGFAFLLDACRLLKDRVAFHCDIFGDGPLMSALTARAAELGLEAVVTLKGSRPHAEVLAALETASVFVLACVQAKNGDQDGTPNSLLEAMARGIPVISTRLSGIPEIIEDEVDGLLVPAGDAGALAEAIARIAGDASLAESMRLQGQREVAMRFTIGRTADAFLESLRSIDAAPRPAKPCAPGAGLTQVVRRLLG